MGSGLCGWGGTDCAARFSPTMFTWVARGAVASVGWGGRERRSRWCREGERDRIAARKQQQPRAPDGVPAPHLSTTRERVRPRVWGAEGGGKAAGVRTCPEASARCESRIMIWPVLITTLPNT
jgi:hypothetical protein